MSTTYFPFQWMVGTFQEILDSSSGNWVRIKSITDLRVLSFVGSSSEVKYSSTELNFGRLRERGWCIVLRSPRFTTLEPPEDRWMGAPFKPGFGLSGGCSDLPRSPSLRLALALEIERHCSADEILQEHLIDLVAFVDVYGAPGIPVEAGVE